MTTSHVKQLGPDPFRLDTRVDVVPAARAGLLDERVFGLSLEELGP